MRAASQEILALQEKRFAEPRSQLERTHISGDRNARLVDNGKARAWGHRHLEGQLESPSLFRGSVAI